MNLMSKYESQLERNERRETPSRVEEHERFGERVVEKIGKKIYNASGEFHEVEDIYRIQESGEAFSMKSLLPEGWKFWRGVRDFYGSNLKDKAVIYGDHYVLSREYTVPESEPIPEHVEREDFIRYVDPDTRFVVEMHSLPQVTQKGFFLHLLHEIGHGHVFEAMSQEDKNAILDITRELKFSKAKSEFSPEERDLYDRFILRPERGAWTWALRTLRRLRQEGIDLAPELNSQQEIIKAISAALSTYEHDLDPEARMEALRTARFIEEGYIYDEE